MLLGMGCASADKPVEIEANDVAAWVAEHPKTQLVDVRTKEEFAEGRIEGAVLMPWTDDDFKQRAAAELNKDVPVLLICKTGRRSLAAGKVLEEMGFKKLLDLKGGMTTWEKEGKPVVKK